MFLQAINIKFRIFLNILSKKRRFFTKSNFQKIHLIFYYVVSPFFHACLYKILFKILYKKKAFDVGKMALKYLLKNIMNRIEDLMERTCQENFFKIEK